jgi:hypothetical protein
MYQTCFHPSPVPPDSHAGEPHANNGSHLPGGGTRCANETDDATWTGGTVTVASPVTLAAGDTVTLS